MRRRGWRLVALAAVVVMAGARASSHPRQAVLDNPAATTAPASSTTAPASPPTAPPATVGLTPDRAELRRWGVQAHHAADRVRRWPDGLDHGDRCVLDVVERRERRRDGFGPSRRARPTRRRPGSPDPRHGHARVDGAAVHPVDGHVDRDVPRREPVPRLHPADRALNQPPVRIAGMKALRRTLLALGLRPSSPDSSACAAPGVRLRSEAAGESCRPTSSGRSRAGGPGRYRRGRAPGRPASRRGRLRRVGGDPAPRPDSSRVDRRASLGAKVELRRGAPSDIPPADLTVVSIPTGARRVAEAALAGGSHVVSTADDPHEIRALISLDAWARGRDRGVVIGTAMAPGLSCVLAAQLRDQLDRVDEVHVASRRTGGPACARRHHVALTDHGRGLGRRRMAPESRRLGAGAGVVPGARRWRRLLPGRSGRSDAAGAGLSRLPAGDLPPGGDPPGSADVVVADAATAASRGLAGAVRVEVRGWLDGRAETRILGVAAGLRR